MCQQECDQREVASISVYHPMAVVHVETCAAGRERAAFTNSCTGLIYKHMT